MARKLGCGPTAIFVFIIALIVFIGTNEAVGFYFGKCDEEDDNFLSCLVDEIANEDEEEKPEEGTVVATGVYTYKSYSVTVTMDIPLKGGAVAGTVSGTCNGHFKGTYNGQQNGAISASMGGACDPFFVNIPATAVFTGTVNKTGKTVPLSFNGQGGGLKHEGSMTLTYR